MLDLATDVKSARYLKVILYLAIFLYVIILLLDDQPITASLFKPQPLVISVTIAAVTAFEKWGWRIRILYPWFVSVPNVIGTYGGTINSLWINPTTSTQIESLSAFLVVSQTLSSIHIRLYTAESHSCSLVGSLTFSADGKQELLFTYRNEPKQEKRAQSSIHYGSARLMLSDNQQKLDGSYWTDRQTVGDMNFSRISRKKAQSFDKCKELISPTTGGADGIT